MTPDRSSTLAEFGEFSLIAAITAGPGARAMTYASGPATTRRC